MSCLSCGLVESRCCTVVVPVPLTPAEAVRYGGATALPRKADGTCVNLATDGSCSDYAERPQACRDQDPGVCRRGGV